LIDAKTFPPRNSSMEMKKRAAEQPRYGLTMREGTSLDVLYGRSALIALDETVVRLLFQVAMDD
jgi:hypothetical protein